MNQEMGIGRLYTALRFLREMFGFNSFCLTPTIWAAGKLLVDMLKRDNDDRLGIYFLSSGGNEITRSKPWRFSFKCSMLNVVGHFGMSWKPEFVSWYENKFIMAECYYNLGNEESALQILNETLSGIEQKWISAGYSDMMIPRYEDISGQSLLEAIMNEKYKALFLNIQSWSDWRRTGYPRFLDSEGNSTSAVCKIRELVFQGDYYILKRKKRQIQIVHKAIISMIG